MTSTPRVPPVVPSFEEKVATTVSTIIEIAVDIGTSLAALERNTRETFWWTSWTIGIVLGLFIVNLLVRVRAQLSQLNESQAVFRRMWDEDRANDERIRREEKRERYIREMKDIRTQQEEMEAAARERARAEARIGEYVDDFLDEMGPVPERDTPEYEEFLDRLRAATRR